MASTNRKVLVGAVVVALVATLASLATRGRITRGRDENRSSGSAASADGAGPALAPASAGAGAAAPAGDARTAVSTPPARPGSISGVLAGGTIDELVVLIDERGDRGRSARPDVRGAFRFDGVSPGRYRLGLSPSDRALSPDAWIHLVPGGEVAGLRVAVVDVASLAVRVERPDGRPAEGALVRVLSGVGAPLAEQRADAGGSVRFATLVRGTSVRVEAGLSSGERAEKALPTLLEPHRDVVLRLNATISASGTVRDPDGHPVAGALIHVYRMPHPTASRSIDRFNGFRATKEVEGVSDDEGRFELAALSVGPKVLVAVHERWAAAARAVDSQDRDLSVAFSRAGHDLAVLVRGPAGPLEGAVVSLLPCAQADRPLLIQGTTERLPLLSETADARGSVLFGGLHEGTVELCVETAGAAPAFFRCRVPSTEPQELRVGVGVIEARLGAGEHALERPILLELESVDGDDRRSAVVQQPRASFDGLGLGPWLVRARDSTPASFEELVVLSADNPDAVVEIELVQNRTVRGTVRSSADQTPIVGARITLGPMDAGGDYTAYVRAPQATWSRAGGLFELEMPAGHYLVTAEHPRFSPTRGTALELLPGNPAPHALEILLAPAAELTGVVRDAAGQPLAHRLVSVVGRMTPEPRYEETKDDGSFAFAGLGADLVQVAIQPSYTRLVELAQGQSLHLEIVLSDGRDLEGTVLLAGVPAAGWKARLIITEGGMGVRMAEIDADGKFRLPALPFGTHDFYVVQGEQQLRSCYHQTVSIGPETPAPLHIDVPVLNVWGRVTTAAGEPAFAFVVWRPVTGSSYRGGTLGEVVSRGMPYSLRTDADGKYAIPVIPPGEYEVFAVNETHGTVWDTRQLRESGEQPDIVLAGGLAVTVEVVDDAGSPVAGAWGILRKTAQEAPSSPLIRQADSTGRLRFHQVPLGTYDLVVQKKGYSQGRGAVSLRAGAEEQMRVVLGAENRLAVQVRGEDEKPVSMAVVLVRDAAGMLALPVAVEDESSGLSWFNRTDPDGRYNAPNLGVGEYRVEAIASDGRRAEQAVRLSGAGGTLSIELVVK